MWKTAPLKWTPLERKKLEGAKLCHSFSAYHPRRRFSYMCLISPLKVYHCSLSETFPISFVGSDEIRPSIMVILYERNIEYHSGEKRLSNWRGPTLSSSGAPPWRMTCLTQETFARPRVQRALMFTFASRLGPSSIWGEALICLSSFRVASRPRKIPHCAAPVLAWWSLALLLVHRAPMVIWVYMPSQPRPDGY